MGSGLSCTPGKLGRGGTGGEVGRERENACELLLTKGRSGILDSIITLIGRL